MKQLIIFNEESQAANYGIGTYIHEIVKLLNKSYKISIIILSSEKKEFDIIKKKQFYEMYIPKYQEMFNCINERNEYMKNVFYLIHPFINQNEEIFFHFNYSTESSVYYLSKLFFPKSKTILTVHYLYWCFNNNGNTSMFREIIHRDNNLVYNNVEKEVLAIYRNELVHFNSVDSIITLSEYTYNLLISEYKISSKKIFFMRNGLKDVYQANLIDRKTEIKDTLLFSRDSYIILFVGRLNKVKGLDYLIQSFNFVLKKIKSAQLVIIGDGDYNEFLKDCKGFGNKVLFLGRMEKDELYNYFQIADIGVMPSFHEQCSYVAIEMMMNSLPIIGSTSTGLKEMIVDGETGLHIPIIERSDCIDIDTSLLAEKILYLLQNPEERKRMGVNARKRYEKMYSSKIMKKQLLNFYNSLI